MKYCIVCSVHLCIHCFATFHNDSVPQMPRTPALRWRMSTTIVAEHSPIRAVRHTYKRTPAVASEGAN